MALSPEDIERHKRHIMLKEIGGPGVARLKAASVSIVGAGALGGPCALYLAAAGVGQIEVWDDDVVDRSNLQRQVQFAEADIGKPKVNVLVDRLRAQNPTINVIERAERFDSESVLAGTILIDASDNFQTRFALDDMAHQTGRYLVSGAASRWSGQVSVFGSGLNQTSPCYRCFVPEEPPEAEACDEVGVVGALTGSIGTAMALEAIKLITGAGTPLIGRLQIHNALESSVRTIKLRPDPECPVCSTGSAR
ncbi:MAG: ThiF family adenylyltransferase [Pseudomonadota bacterium]